MGLSVNYKLIAIDGVLIEILGSFYTFVYGDIFYSINHESVVLLYSVMISLVFSIDFSFVISFYWYSSFVYDLLSSRFIIILFYFLIS